MAESGYEPASDQLTPKTLLLPTELTHLPLSINAQPNNQTLFFFVVVQIKGSLSSKEISILDFYISIQG